MEVICERGRDILAQPLPSLSTRDGFRTVTDSRHRLWFNQQMGHGKSFPTEVRAMIDEREFKPDYLHVRPKSPDGNPNRVCNEHVLCGDEQSVCGRISANVFQLVTAVACNEGIQIRFGDYKVCQESHWDPNACQPQNVSAKTIPDFVAIEDSVARDPEAPYDENNPHLRFVGEAKTGWVHNLHDDFHDYEKATVFEKGVVKLYYSRPIPHNASPLDGPFKDGQPAVSVRECFFYMIWKTENVENSRFVNSMLREKWVVTKAAYISKDQAPATPYNRAPARGAIPARHPLQPSPLLPGGALEAKHEINQGRYFVRLPQSLVHDAGPSRPYIIINGDVHYLDLRASQPRDRLGSDRSESPSDGRHQRKLPHDLGSTKVSPFLVEKGKGHSTAPRPEPKEWADERPSPGEDTHNLPIRASRSEYQAPAPSQRQERDQHCTRDPMFQGGTDRIRPMPPDGHQAPQQPTGRQTRSSKKSSRTTQS
ncbi:hypothetical protein FQN50_008544 [Emmonsiellopsis sp. PD_5]|nr:hypothetical protein FQN50_008544 [Emmonsiellopsis sp. PD_5]